jgi:hypothetical protein
VGSLVVISRGSVTKQRDSDYTKRDGGVEGWWQSGGMVAKWRDGGKVEGWWLNGGMVLSRGMVAK